VWVLSVSLKRGTSSRRDSSTRGHGTATDHGDQHPRLRCPSDVDSMHAYTMVI
jgi:hypothetical protein